MSDLGGDPVRVLTTAEYVGTYRGSILEIDGRVFVVTRTNGRRMELAMCETALEAARTSLGWTQQDVADRLGISQATVVRAERGTRVMDATVSAMWRLYAEGGGEAN